MEISDPVVPGVESASVIDEDASLLLLGVDLARRDAWDAPTWRALLDALRLKPFPVAALWFERAARLFPTSAGVWLPYLARAQAHGRAVGAARG